MVLKVITMLSALHAPMLAPGKIESPSAVVLECAAAPKAATLTRNNAVEKSQKRLVSHACTRGSAKCDQKPVTDPYWCHYCQFTGFGKFLGSDGSTKDQRLYNEGAFAVARRKKNMPARAGGRARGRGGALARWRADGRAGGLIDAPRRSTSGRAHACKRRQVSGQKWCREAPPRDPRRGRAGCGRASISPPPSGCLSCGGFGRGFLSESPSRPYEPSTTRR